jgi:hypothetical protein
MTLQALAIHTEQIHDDRVWARLRSLLDVMSRRRSRATFFVYPFRAIVAGRGEVAFERVKRLREEGYEIGQHTHFYAGRAIDKPNKVLDLDNDNVRRCLERDYQWLGRIVSPRGFTSGAWVVQETLYPTLAELAFNYDCSSRSLTMEAGDSGHAVWLEHPEVRRCGEHSLLLLPTTHTVKHVLRLSRWPGVTAASGRVRYRLVYFHDYDLLRWEFYIAVSLILRLGGIGMTCAQVAATVMNSEDGFNEC